MMEPQETRVKHVKSDKSIAGLYDLERSLGSGHFAVVKLARHVFTGEKVAVKVIDKTKLDDVAKAHLYQEVRCMKLVQHPNVVRLYEVIDTQTKLYLILEYGDGGDMYDHIMRYEGQGISENQARHYFKQIVSAIDYCHKLHVVHRDLKPENVIFFKSQDIAKLTDFGFSNSFLPGEKLYTSCGSLAYSAPEILLGDSYDAPAVDVWSLGVILYMMVCGKGPFNHANDSETLTMIMDCQYDLPDELSIECKSLISRMLVRLPNRRASLDSIVNDPWVCQANISDKLPSPPTKPLISEIHISKDVHLAVLQKMEINKVASKEEIEKSLQQDRYDHVTATYFLFAERILKRRLGTIALHVRLEERHSYPYEYLAKKGIDGDHQIKSPSNLLETSSSASNFDEYDYPVTNDLTKEHSQSDECLSDNSASAFEAQMNTTELQTKTLPARSRLSFPPSLYANKKTKSTPNLLNGITEENESELEDSPRTSPILQRRASQRRRKYHTCRLSPIHSRRSSCSSSDDDEMHMFSERRRLATLVTSQSTTTNQSTTNEPNNTSSENKGNPESGSQNNLSSLDFENEDYLSKKMASFFDHEDRNNLLNLLLPTLNLKLGTNATTYGRHLSDTNLTSYSTQLQLALAKCGLKQSKSNSNLISSLGSTSHNTNKQNVQKKSSSDTNLMSTLYKEKHNILFASDFFKSKDFYAKYLKIRNGTRCSSRNSSNLSLSSPIEEEPTSDLPFRCNENTQNTPSSLNQENDFIPFTDVFDHRASSPTSDIINSKLSPIYIPETNNKLNEKTKQEDLRENDLKIVELSTNTSSSKRQISTYTARRGIQVVPAKNLGSVCCSLV